MWIKSAQVYRLPRLWQMTAAMLAEALASQAFTPCNSHDAEQVGWVAPFVADELVHVVNRQFILKLCKQTKVLPGAVVNKAVREKAAELEEQQGFPPGKKATKELKERIRDELLAKAFAKDEHMLVWIDPVNGWLVIDAASASKADAAIKLLLKAVDKMPLESLRVQRSPAAVMTEWLDTDEAPYNFTLDQDATLKATGESSATVRYTKHTLDPEDMRRHIANGKRCVRLAMTWASRVSFVLDDGMTIKSIKPLDVIKEGTAITYSDQERADNDLTLMTGEMAKLLADLVEALGGEATNGQPGGDGQHQISEGTAQDAARKLHQMAVDEGASVTLSVGGQTVATFGAPEGDDPMYDQAVAVVLKNRRASISLVQRHLRIGYNRAARLIEQMEKGGVVSAPAPTGEREIIQ